MTAEPNACLDLALSNALDLPAADSIIVRYAGEKAQPGLGSTPRSTRLERSAFKSLTNPPREERGHHELL